jgi:hypothetical protein
MSDYLIKGWLLFGFAVWAPVIATAEYFGRPNERR